MDEVERLAHAWHATDDEIEACALTLELAAAIRERDDPPPGQMIARIASILAHAGEFGPSVGARGNGSLASSSAVPRCSLSRVLGPSTGQQSATDPNGVRAATARR
jgi:hypothetical protein